jgi:hypothetical protein
VALAIAIVAAGVIALATRDARTGIVAATIVTIATPVFGASVPAPLPLAGRLVAGILAGYLLWAAVRGRVTTSGSAIGWPAEVLLAGAAALTAGSAALASSALAGPVEAAAVGAALLTVALGPLLVGRDTLRVALAAIVAVHGLWLTRAGILGPGASAGEELAVAALVASLGGVGAALVIRARGASGGLELGVRRPVGVREPPSARAPGSGSGSDEPGGDGGRSPGRSAVPGATPGTPPRGPRRPRSGP